MFGALILIQQPADIIADRDGKIAAVAVVIFVIHRIRVGNRHAVIKAPLIYAVGFMAVGGDVVFVEHQLVFGNCVWLGQISDCNLCFVLVLNFCLMISRVQRIKPPVII